MKNGYWHIEGYDSFEKIYDKRVAAGCITKKQMESLLKTLAAKTNLSFDEIVGAHAKRKTRISNNLLEVQVEFSSGHMSCGENPYFVARIVT